MSVSFAAQTGLVLVDARPRSGTCFLPLSAGLLGRTVTIKDAYGVAAVSSIQIRTNSPDTFEDGTTSRWINHNYGFMNIAAIAANVWTVVGGTIQPSFQASTISSFLVNTQAISTLQSAVSQEAVSTLSVGTAYIGTLSTANLTAPSPLFSTIQTFDTGTKTYTSISLSSSFVYLNGSPAPTLVIPAQLLSTMGGLGTAGYISSLSLQSTVTGLATAGYVSTFSLTSTVANLGTASYISSTQLTSSVQGLMVYISSFIDATEITSTVLGLGTNGFVSTLGLTYSLTSTTQGLGTIGFISTTSLTSTTQGLGLIGFVSTASLISTTQGLSTLAASSFTGSTVSLSAGTIYVSSLGANALTTSSLTVSQNAAIKSILTSSLQTSTMATAFHTLSTLNISDYTTPSTGALYQISSVLYYNSTVIGGVTAANIQAFTF